MAFVRSAQLVTIEHAPSTNDYRAESRDPSEDVEQTPDEIVARRRQPPAQADQSLRVVLKGRGVAVPHGESRPDRVRARGIQDGIAGLRGRVQAALE